MADLRRLAPFGLIVIAGLAGAWRGGALRPGENLRQQVVATVGKEAISEADLDVAMAQVSGDLQPSLDREMRSEILDKLIAEELLLQYGLDHRIQETDPVLRMAIVRTMLSLACSPFPDTAAAFQTTSSQSTSVATTANGCDSRASSSSLSGDVDRYVEWLGGRARISEVADP